MFVLSTKHNLSATTILKRPKGEREKKPTPCPTAIVDYNQYMGGEPYKPAPLLLFHDIPPYP